MVSKQILLAFVGMPGSGKSEATSYLEKKGIPRVRFGALTENVLKERKLPVTSENEQNIREELRKTWGMDIFAKKAESKIREFFATSKLVVIDGLYSWEEYLFLKAHFISLVVIHVFAERQRRYKRLAARVVRPLSYEEAQTRDRMEIEKLNKGGPIAIADFIIENDNTVEQLHTKLESLLKRVLL